MHTRMPAFTLFLSFFIWCSELHHKFSPLNFESRATDDMGLGEGLCNNFGTCKLQVYYYY